MKQLLIIRFPTALGLILLIVGVGATLFLNRSAAIFDTRAATDDTPQNIRITNVTDTAVTISYTTPIGVLGTIMYGESKDPRTIALDDRDLPDGKASPHTSHYFTLTDLRQDTEYYFTILSGSSTYLHNGSPFMVRTARIMTDSPPNLPQFSGTVVLPEGALSNEVILFLQSDTSQPVSTLIRPDTSYIISLANLRTLDTASFATLTPDSTLHLFFTSEYGDSTVTIRAGQKNPIPPLVITKNYDFTHSVQQLPPTQPSESFPILNTKAVKGARTVFLPPVKQPTKKLRQQTASPSGTTVLGTYDTSTGSGKTTIKKVSFASLPRPDTHSIGDNKTPLLVSGILGSIALFLGIFAVSFIRRATS